MDMETKSLCNLLPHVDPSVSITAGILSGARFAKKPRSLFSFLGFLVSVPGCFLSKACRDAAKMITASSAEELIQRCWVSGRMRRESPADRAI